MSKLIVILMAVALFGSGCSSQSVDSSFREITIPVSNSELVLRGYWLSPNQIDFSKLDEFDRATRLKLSALQAAVKEHLESDRESTSFTYPLDGIPATAPLLNHRIAYGFTPDEEESTIFFRLERTGPDVAVKHLAAVVKLTDNEVIVAFDSDEPPFAYLRDVWSNNNHKIRFGLDLSSVPLLEQVCTPCYHVVGAIKKVDIYCVAERIKGLSVAERKQLSSAFLK